MRRSGTSSHTAQEAEFLSPAESVMRMPSSQLVLRIWLLLIGALLVTLIWAYVAETDIVVKAPARLVGDVRTQQLTAPETAKVLAIHVRDGQSVQAGDLLVEFDMQAAKAELEKTSGLLAAARSHLSVTGGFLGFIRSVVLSDGSRSDHDPAHHAARRSTHHAAPLEERHPDVSVSRFHAQLQTQLENQLQASLPVQLRSQSQTQLQAHINDFMARLTMLEAGIRKFEWLLGLHAQRASDYLRLKQEGYMSHAAWQEREQVRLEAMANLRDAQQQREALIARSMRETQDALAEARRLVAALEQDEQRARVNLERLRVRSPVTGTVQQLAVHTEGAVIAAAAPLLQIAPSDSGLEVQAFLSQRDAAFVKPGHLARLRLDAYDYTRYGLFDASVRYMSPDASSDEKQGPFYVLHLDLKAGSSGKPASLSSAGQRIALKTGLSGTVDIHTGRRRVIDYFLSPFQRSAHESLRER